MKAYIEAYVKAFKSAGIPMHGTLLNYTWGIFTDSEDGSIQAIYTDSEDGQIQQILIDTEDR